MAASIIFASSFSTSAPSASRVQRVGPDGSIGGPACRYVSPVYTSQYGFSTQPDAFLIGPAESALQIQQPGIGSSEAAGRQRLDRKRSLIAALILPQSIRSA
jgi:hypothetical protein